MIAVLIFFAAIGLGEAAVVELDSSADLVDASRGRGRYAGLPSGTTFLIRDGIYQTPDEVRAVIWVRKGGTKESKRRFVGESRDGVKISGRATISADYVELANMTFDLRGFSPEEERSFSTVGIVDASHIIIRSLTCTGDGTKGRRGGHIEVRALTAESVPENIIIEDCLVEGFGRTKSPKGRLDHGIYLGEGRKIRVKGCEVRQNAGRGIQLFSHFADSGMLRDVLIEDNLVHHNGRERHTEGIVVGSVNSRAPDVIDHVVIRNNIIHSNAFAGIRLNTSSCTGLEISGNTFWNNAADHESGSEFFLEEYDNDSPISVSRNVFVTRTRALTIRGGQFRIDSADNVVDGDPGDLLNAARMNGVLKDPDRGDFTVTLPGRKDVGARVQP